MSILESPTIEKELYLLIIKFLENGPCHNAAQALRREVESNELIPPRKDWNGKNHKRTLVNFETLNHHIPNDYLLQISKRLTPLLQQCHPTSVRCIESLLPRGRLSLLRENNENDSPFYFLSTSRHAALRNTVTPPLPLSINNLSPVPILNGRCINGSRGKANIINHCNIYSKFALHKQILGHLASVYCVLYDQTGSVIATGADDNLVKLWSARDGRLIATFRGHAAQITDISVNKENTFIASGSLDKTVRVWSLEDTHPVAVLQGHTGMITSLNFCPSADKVIRYLVSTGGDGHVCFWPWSPTTQEFSLTPSKFNEKSRPGAQMLSSSFSPGGTFLATGSSDNYIRVYQLYPDGPDKIAELPNHVDHVDSIMYSNYGDRFLSGSRDGTAMIWSFYKGEWIAKCIDVTKSRERRHGSEPDSLEKLKVTMITWSCNDQYVVTATTDHIIRVWNSHHLTFLHALHGHTDEMFLLEPHPTDPYIMLSAGHDGCTIIWNINTGTKIKSFFNVLEGQGHGAIFDAKFSPSGDQFSVTDGHGHLMIFGYGSDIRFQLVPYEQFFHTDYRPIIRDVNNYVLDEQSQTAPHLLPPPFLVDMDGNPHTSNFQMLIPGRTTKNLPQRRLEQQQQQQDELPPLLVEIREAEAAQRNLLSPGFRSRQNSHISDSGLLSPTGFGGGGNGGISGGGGGGGVGLRESGDVEGVRQQNSLYISGDITDTDAELWRHRKIIPKNKLFNQIENELNRLKLGVEEIQIYLKEKSNAKVKHSDSNSDISENTKRFLRTTARGRGRGRGRQAKVRQPVTYVRESAMRSHDYSSAGREVVNIDVGTNGTSSDSAPEDWQGESSDTTDSSDFEWVAHDRKAKKSQEKAARKRVSKAKKENSSDEEEIDVVGGGGEERRSRRKIKKTRRFSESSLEIEDEDEIKNSSSDEESVRKVEVKVESGSEAESNSVNEDSSNHSDSEEKQNNRRKYKKMKEIPQQQKPYVKKVKKEIKSRNPPPPISNKDEYLQFYQPPEWLLSNETPKFPYVPQIGDEVYYILQGHCLYVQQVIEQNVYDIQEGRQAYKRYDLDAAELCKLVGVLYDVGPPKMCSLKLELISKKKATGGKKTITVRFHDMPNVVDFLVLRHIYEKSLDQDWKEGDRFRCIIDELWYYGAIDSVSPLHEDHPTSPFLCLFVKWDSGEEERLSPWDLEKIVEDEDEDVESRPVTDEDKSLYKYAPTKQDWPHESLSDLTERLCQGIDDFTQESMAAPFAFPVDVQYYPSYWSFIAFPTDLETIKKKLRKRFYRRMESLLWEIRQLKTNASKFNEQGSDIVIHAAEIVKLFYKFIREPGITNILELHEDMKSGSNKNKVIYEESEEEIEEEEYEDIENEQNTQGSSTGGSSGASSASGMNKSWIVEAKSLLEFISSKDDAHPFRQPVDPVNFPDYAEVISEPVDLSTIRQRLDSNQYDTADAYIHDFQLMFRNSKSYNTDRRSLIYKMTLRLSALFETRCISMKQTYEDALRTKVHWTRGKTRSTDSRSESQVEDSKSSSKRTCSRQVEDSKSSSKRPYSPRKFKPTVTIDDFVQKPITRASNIENPSRNTRKLRVKIKQESYSENDSDEESASENLSPSVQESKQVLRSGRVSFKRPRYGFDSDNETNENNVKRKKQEARRSSQSDDSQNEVNVKRKKKESSQKNIKKTKSKQSKQSNSRTSRQKSAINYCDDYYEEDEIETNQSSDSTSNDDDSDQSDDDIPSSVATVSSRGRVRKVAKRFTDL